MEYSVTIYCENEALNRLVFDRLHAELKSNSYYRKHQIIISMMSSYMIHIWIQFGVEIPSCLEMSNIDKIVKECKEALK